MKALILGLDLSSVNTGYAVFGLLSKEGVSISSLDCLKSDFKENIEGFGSIKPNKKFDHTQKIHFIYEAIKKVLNDYDISAVAIEDQYFRSNAKTLKLLSRICGVAMLAAHESGCTVDFYTASRVKKYLSGKGNASKKDMVEAAVERFNLSKGEIDDNIADAMGVGFTHIERKIRGITL